jgi:hypothetical protein
MELAGRVAVVASVRARGGEALGIRTDVSDLASVQAPPARLANAPPSAEEPVELMGRTLDAAAVADMVVDAIRANRLYVITHEEGLEALRRRHERLEQALLQPKA